ncbi:hypothetical protein ACRAWD_16540 [Caulobacter segnis]
MGSVSGNTQIHGTSGDDLIDLRGVKLTQIQYITGELGNDTIHGTYDNDVIMGAGGLDTIYGESGDDRIYFTAYGDTDAVDGGSGLRHAGGLVAGRDHRRQFDDQHRGPSTARVTPMSASPSPMEMTTST